MKLIVIIQIPGVKVVPSETDFRHGDMSKKQKKKRQFFDPSPISSVRVTESVPDPAFSNCQKCNFRLVHEYGRHLVNMRFIADYSEARRIDKSTKNKWRSEWLQEEDDLNRKFSLWLRKIDEAGEAWCNLCSKRVSYGSNGKKVFAIHASDLQHVQRLNAQ